MKIKKLILIILLLLSVIFNVLLFRENQNFRNADERQEKLFVAVSDSLTYFSMQRDSLAHRK